MQLLKAQSASLGRIARAYRDHLEGGSDSARVLEVVRQELSKVDQAASRARRLTGPVRGKADVVHAATPATSRPHRDGGRREGESGLCNGAAIG